MAVEHRFDDVGYGLVLEDAAVASQAERPNARRQRQVINAAVDHQLDDMRLGDDPRNDARSVAPVDRERCGLAEHVVGEVGCARHEANMKLEWLRYFLDAAKRHHTPLVGGLALRRKRKTR